MKFHRLQLKNLNSLYGEHEIDFGEDLAGAPLFLIRGPTGSGKTTILDAICMALFGTTPRLRDIGRTKERCAHILSEGQGKAEIELDFSLVGDEGRVFYRAKWTFWRAHERAGGTPQDPRRSLHILDHRGEETDELVNSRTQDTYDAAFKEVLRGLTVDDFLRSVMLAQNDFAAFLKAGQEEKASILERLTRTDRYQEIGATAARRWREKKNEVQDQEQRIETIAADVPDEEKVAELSEELSTLKESKTALQAQIDELETNRDWLQGQERLVEKLEKAGEAREEASKKRQKAAKDFERLEAADAVEPGREPLVEFERHREELEELKTKRESLEDKREQLEADVEASKGRKDKTKEQLDAARDELEEARPVIEEARRLESKRDDAKELRDKAKEELDERRKTLDGLTAEAEEAAEAVEEKKKAFREAKKRLEESGAHEALIEEFAGLKARVESFVTECEKSHKWAQKIEAFDAQIEDHREQLEELQREVDGQKEAIEPLEKAYEVAGQEVAELRGEAESARARRGELNEARDAYREELRALADCRERLRKCKEKARVRDERRDSIKNMNQWRQDLQEKIEANQQSRQEIVDKKKELQSRRAGLEVKNRLDEIRRGLEDSDGEACPVCGSREHPIFESGDARSLHRQVVAELDEVNEEIEAVDDEIEELDKKLEAQKEELTSLSTEMEGETKRLGEDQTAIDGLHAELSARADAVDEDLMARLEEADEPQELVEEESKGRRQAIADSEQALDKLDDAVELRETARRRLEDAKKTLQEQEGLVEKKETSLSALREQRKSRQNEWKELRADLDDTKSRLDTLFANVGIELGEPEDSECKQCEDWAPVFDAALEDAEAVRDDFVALQEEVDELDKACQEAEQHREQLDSKIETAKQEVEKAAKTYGGHKEQIEELREELDVILKGRKLDEWEKSLTEGKEEANDAYKMARKEFEEAEKKLAGATENLKTNAASIKARKKSLNDAEEQLASAMEELAVEDRETLRDRLMEPEALGQLRAKCSKIAEELGAAEKLYESLSEELKAHRNQRPDKLDDDVALEALVERIEELKKESDKLHTSIGKLGEKVDEAGRKKEALSEARKKLEEIEREAKPWKELHNLIGTGDGKHFKLFAQSLNLGEIIRHANRHLSTLVDRYELAVKRGEQGFPTLDFEVIDQYHAGRRRALSTLSGGETFLISLALSLALADNRRLDLPIETIFLDEGFGTLDQEALQTALDCLNQLHYRGGRTVGVISHVEALAKEGGIPHHVVLETVRDGVSRVRIDTA